ncbi:hypothetical protein T484DRAFT_1955425 [Baffinella frigidus]|nr:hypothetical protein T484DRAFT_1955425 [Cryptophyta sp. CCMP2293]
MVQGRRSGVVLVGVACCTLTMCAVLAVFSPAPIELETAAVHDMRLGDAQLRRAQQLMQAGVQGAKRLSVSRKAKMQQLEGIGGIGSGEEDENGKDWEVAMHVDKGCQETLDLRAQGNPGWKMKGTPHVSCTANRRVNPMQWPFAEPGQVWAHDSHDGTRDAKKWPYAPDNLNDFVESADPTPAWADGVWHPLKGESYQKAPAPRPRVIQYPSQK